MKKDDKGKDHRRIGERKRWIVSARNTKRKTECRRDEWER